MLYKREGYPEENELVLCTVSKVQSNSVFVALDEYGMDGLIHISEISPGRIRNIREFVKEGKKIVCKVLRVNRERQQIDLSLRRVSEGQRRNKISELKQEQTAEKIVEHVASTIKRDMKDAYKELTSEVSQKYDSLHAFFQDVVNDVASFSDLKLDKTLSDELEREVKQRLKPVEVSIKGTLTLVSYDPDGVEVLRNAIKKALSSERVAIKYLGAGHYDITVTADDYKQAEAIMDESTTAAIEFLEASKGVAEFARAK